MKTKCLITIILMLAMVQLAYAIEECQSTMNPSEGLNCTITSTWAYSAPCSSHYAAIYNTTGSHIQNLTFISQGTSDLCFALWNITTTGSYNYVIDTGDTGTILIEGEDNFQAIAIIMGIITLCFVYFAIHSRHIATQIAFGLLSLLMIVADFRIATMLTEVIDPAQTGIISHLNTFYFIGITILRVAFIAAILYVLYKLFAMIANWNNRKRQIKEQEFL